MDSKEMKPVEIKMKNLLEPHLWVVPFLWFPIKGPFEKLCLTKLSKNLLNEPLICWFLHFLSQHHLQKLTMTDRLFQWIPECPFPQPGRKAE